jgi:hypothetical protein
VANTAASSASVPTVSSAGERNTCSPERNAPTLPFSTSAGMLAPVRTSSHRHAGGASVATVSIAAPAIAISVSCHRSTTRSSAPAVRASPRPTASAV